MSEADIFLDKATRFLKLANEFGNDDVAETPPKDGVPKELFKFFWDLKRMVGNITGSQYVAWIKANENISILNRPFPDLIEHCDWDYYYHHKTPYLEAVTGNRNKRIRIYPSKTDDGDIKESALLTGSQGVPTLWIYVGDFTDRPMTQSVGKELSHNYFIWEAFAKGMFHLHPNDPRSIELMTNFVHDNKAKINSLRKWFSKTPEFLGAGVDGSAFDVGNYVLKIFSSEAAYNAAMEAWERLHKNPALAKTEAMIYDVGVLGECSGSTIYYYIMEKMTAVRGKYDNNITRELRPLIRQIAFDLMHKSHLKHFKKQNLEPEVLKKEIDKISATISASFKDDKHVEAINEWDPTLRPTWLPTLVEEIAMKFLTNRNDLHTGNIGVTNNGEFRYFDPAYGEGEKSKIHLGGGDEV